MSLASFIIFLFSFAIQHSAFGTIYCILFVATYILSISHTGFILHALQSSLQSVYRFLFVATYFLSISLLGFILGAASLALAASLFYPGNFLQAQHASIITFFNNIPIVQMFTNTNNEHIILKALLYHKGISIFSKLNISCLIHNYCFLLFVSMLFAYIYNTFSSISPAIMLLYHIITWTKYNTQ